MRLYEHEAKTVLADAGIHVPRRLALLHTPDDPCNASINAGAMVKAQTLIGGRGKVGGIRRVQLAAELRAAAREILSMRIHGYPVQSVLVEEALESSAACYLGVTLNPATFHNVIIASTAGGVDIEEAARVRPESILRLELADSPAALDPADARKVAAFLAAGLQNLSGVENREALVAALADVTAKLYAAYQTHDAKVLEINPLLITSSGPVAADAKMVLDDNALFRQTDLLAKLGIEGKRHEDAESTGETPRTAGGFPFIDLLPEDFQREPGKIYVGLVPGGAGYGIFSIDEVTGIGERFFDGRLVPLNFMDSGGGPTLQSVAEMFSLLMDWPLVDVIVTSRFGGISSCDIFIRGLVDCLRKRHAEGRRVVPIYGRMVGTDLMRRAGVPRNRPPPDARATGQSVDGRRQPGNHGGGHSQRHRRLPRPKGSSIMSSTSYIPVRDGMLAYLVGKVRPALAARIAREGRIETAVIGLGKQGTRHAALMKEFGTTVAAAVAAEKGGSRVAESIPVYNTVADMLAAHPHIAAASIWKHYSTAAEATIEAIEAGIPILVLISEGMPVRDVQRVLAAARQHDTLLLGPNTPGVIFPPEASRWACCPTCSSRPSRSPTASPPKASRSAHAAALSCITCPMRWRRSELPKTR